MNKESYYSLKRDVNSPGNYYLKGTVKTFSQWEKIFGELNDDDIVDWFDEMPYVEQEEIVEHTKIESK